MNYIDKVINVLSDKKLFKDINISNMNIFRKIIVPQIYEEQKNFPREKYTIEWKKFRKYSAPPSKFMIGVYTGQTYTALIGIKTPNRNILIETTDKKNIITIENSKYLNSTLYLDENSKELLLNNSKEMILEALK